MHFLENDDIEKYAGALVEAPALFQMKDQVKGNLKEIFKEFFKELYLNRTSDLKNFMNYEITSDYMTTVFDQYGIEKEYHDDINKSVKKILVYYIERLYQIKGSANTLDIFAELFENIFGKINFYQVVVVKKTLIKDGVEQYFFSYALEPLLINDRSQILEKLDEKISLRGKHLMSLDQYKDYKVFPVKTNLIYMHFISNPGMNTDNTFEFAVRCYAHTILSNQYIRLDNMYDTGISFNFAGKDIGIILDYFEAKRLRKFEDPGYAFTYLKKINTNLVFAQEHLETIMDVLHEYKTLKYSDRKAVDNLRRKWTYLTQNYATIEKPYDNYTQMEEYMSLNYPEIVQLDNNLLTIDDYMYFYVEFYNKVIEKIDTNDDYLMLYINAVFLNILTGEVFLDNFFAPVYKLFQKYFFPIDLDFINTSTDIMFRRNKFDSFGTSQDVHQMLYLNGFMSKYHEFPDYIRMNFNFRLKEYIQTLENIGVLIKTQYTSDNISNEVLKQEERYSFQFWTFHDDNQELKEKSSVILLTELFDIESENIEDDVHVTLEIIQDEYMPEYNKSSETLKNYIGETYDLYRTLINLLNTDDITKLKENNFIQVQPRNNDEISQNYDDKFSAEIDRFNYLVYIENQFIFWTMYNESVRKYTSWEDNLSFKYQNQSDAIYYNYYDLYS